MNSKNYKISALALSFLLLSLAFLESAKASTMGPTLSSISPNQAPSGYEAIVSGLSYRDGSEIVFYKGPTEKLRVGAVPPPALPINSLSSPSIPDPSSTEFKFTVPSLSPDLYNIRLEHIAKLGVSEPLPFAIVPVVSGISPRAGNHLSLYEVTGTGFIDVSQKNLVRFSPGQQLIPAEVTNSSLRFNLSTYPTLPVGSYEIQVFTRMEEKLIESAYIPGLNRNVVLYPHLNSILPGNGMPDSQIAIAGIYLHNDTAKIRVNFYRDDKKQAEVQPGQALFGGSAIFAVVPKELTPGNYTIKVSVLDATNPARWIESDNSFTFTVIAPPVTPAKEPTSEPLDDQEAAGSETEEG